MKELSNREITDVLGRIAKILELEGKESDRFRIVAYERAAQSIGSHGEDLADIYERQGLKGLQNIEGVGLSIAQKIEELFKTGKLKYFEQIQKKVPHAEVDFMKIPGIGPKTAILLSEKLKAKDIEELEKKLKTPEALEFFKEKTRSNILRGIEILKGFEGRMLLVEALPIAEKYLTHLKKTPGVLRTDMVGSLRRMKETVGDIDIVASATDPQKAVKSFTSIPLIKQVLAAGENKAAAIDRSGIRVDLEILPRERYGSLIQHLTGSKEHNVSLRTFANSIGKSLSEHGVKTGKGTKAKLKTFQKEEDFYKGLGMDFIPPELREDRGEIEAARAHRLPKLIELEDIKGDLQVHSKYSDGNATIEEIAKAAQKMGYEYIAITDHSVGLGVAGGLDKKGFARRTEEIKKVQKKFKNLKILNGCEVNIRSDATLDLDDETLKSFDIVIAAIHSSFFQSEEKMTERLLSAIHHPSVHIIAHPSGRLIGEREPYQVDWEKIFQEAHRFKTILEINAYPNRLDLNDSLVFKARKLGVKFVISTDAHSPQQLELIRFGVATARRGWAEKKDILNTLGLKELLTWLK